jgi:hypothetical protein
MVEVKMVIIVCKTCNKKFKVYKYREYVAKFCSYICRNKSKRGEDAFNWKGGIETNNGYIRKYCLTHPYKGVKNKVYAHRLVMEKYLGRYLKPNERVHHINGVKKDNRIQNLMLFSNESEHQKFHAKHS